MSNEVVGKIKGTLTSHLFSSVGHIEVITGGLQHLEGNDWNEVVIKTKEADDTMKAENSKLKEQYCEYEELYTDALIEKNRLNNKLEAVRELIIFHKGGVVGGHSVECPICHEKNQLRELHEDATGFRYEHDQVKDYINFRHLLRHLKDCKLNAILEGKNE